MPTNRLNGKCLSRLPTGSHGDGHGLALLVKPTGSRSWIQRLKVLHGPMVTMGLGGFPVVTLREAREVALDNKRMARKGIDPVIPKAPTFEAVAILWERERRKSPWSDYKPFRSRFDRITLPTMGKVGIDNVTAEHVRRVVAKSGSVSESKKAVREVGHVLDYAVAHNLRTDNPVPTIQKTIRAPKAEHRAYMEPDALRAALPNVECVLIRFLAFVPVRVREALGMRWDEIDADGNWTIPAARMGKTKADHLVPLPDGVRAMLDKLPKHGELVFARAKTGKAPDHKTVTAWKDSCLPDTDLHGFRSTFLTWIGKSGLDVKMGERCLAHTVDGAITQAYQRYSYANEKAALLEQWFVWLTKGTVGGLSEFFPE